MKLLNKLSYWFHCLISLRTNEFMQFITFLNRMDDKSIYYLGGSNKLIQISGEINDYHWFEFISKPDNRFYQAIDITYGSNEATGLTDRQVCIQIMSNIFTRKEILFLSRLILSLPKDKTNFIKTDQFSLNVAEAVAANIYRIEGKMCTYTIK